jgi:hypothetical protein
VGAAASKNPGAKPAGEPLAEAIIRRTLTAVLDAALPEAKGVEYRFGGTASSVLRGIRMPAGDMDLLLRERRGVDQLSAATAALPGTECLFAPAWLEEGRQYFSRYLVDGAVVEFSTVEWETDSDAMECFGPGPWEHFDLVPCGPHQVPVVATELRLITELTRNRPERYGPILTHLREHGCDLALVRRGMADRKIPDALQAEVLAQLGASRS